MSNPLSKNFEPQAVEERWYQQWLDKGYFNSKPDERKFFLIQNLSFIQFKLDFLYSTKQFRFCFSP
jgi:hypothetical protein